MLEKWKNSADKEKEPVPLLTDLSKVFNCLSEELTIAKLNVYESDLPALFLSHKKQSNKVNSAYKSWEEILFGVAEGCVLALVLFNIFLRDLFLVISDTGCSSYIDDNARYDPGNNLDDVIIKE